LTAASAFFLLTRAPRQQPVHSSIAATKTVARAAPPEIITTRECNYVVQKGDSLDKIALKNNLTLENLLAYNPNVKKGSALQVGQKLDLCGETP
jgi:LysM repeat protein